MPLKYLRVWRSRLQQRSLNVRSWNDLAADSLLRGATIALVGNAGYLAETQQGEFIDSHDIVIRMNNFRTSGFEPCVGRRTDVFLTNFWEDIDFVSPDAAGARFVASSMPNNFRTVRRRGVALRHGPMITAGMRKMGRREVFVPPLEWFLQRISQIGRYPTTGGVGVMLAVEHLLASARSLYITGFSFFEGRNHYFSQREKDTANHNVDREKQLLGELLLPLTASKRVTLDESMQSSLPRAAAA